MPLPIALKRASVEQCVISKVAGMFRWVQYQLDTLEDCTDSEQIYDASSSLLRDLSTTYERILTKVERRNIRSIRQVLIALVYSKRPLTIVEIENTLRVTPSDNRKIGNKEIYMKTLLDRCSSLITITKSDHPGGN